MEVVWVEGNHDYGLAQMMSHLVGVPVYQEYLWESEGERYLAIHGHQFDNFIIKNRFFINGVSSSAYLALQKLSSKGKRIARLIERLNTRLATIDAQSRRRRSGWGWDPILQRRSLDK